MSVFSYQSIEGYHGVVANVPDWDIVVSKFENQSRY